MQISQTTLNGMNMEIYLFLVDVLSPRLFAKSYRSEVLYVQKFISIATTDGRLMRILTISESGASCR